ncbi:MAG: DUF4179 domain-containing protein [Lachnospiraceae bacterium]|nr:DUF4179 domain-containing protein [Lachnospiraceae bacterium]
MNIYQNVPEQFHKQYLETLALLSEEKGSERKRVDGEIYKGRSAEGKMSGQKAVSDVAARNPKKHGRNNIWLWIGRAGAAAAAVFFTALVLYAADPALAANLPAIGHIFSALQDRFGFGQIPEEGTVILVPEETNPAPSSETQSEAGTHTAPVNAFDANASNTQEANAANDPASVSDKAGSIRVNPYQATDNGVTLSVEEYYASNQAIFLGIRMVTEEPLSQDLTDKMIFLSTETYSFRADDPHSGSWDFEFERIDDHTFLGIMRIDYVTIGKDLRKYTEAVKKAEETGATAPVLSAETESQYVSYYEIPESFDLDIAFKSLWIYHTGETAGTSRQSIKGSWNISGIPIQQNAEGMQTISVNEVNEEGFGIYRIELSPLEMTIYPVEPIDHDTFTMVLDRDGQMLHSGGNNCYQLAVQGHDISEITIYICDYVEYMDELKGYILSHDSEASKSILDEHCLYSKVIMLE